MRSIKELINNAKKKFLVQWVITRWEICLAAVIDSIHAVACRPMMFHFHGAKIFRAERREKRDNCIAKSNCGKRSRHGELFQFERCFHRFNPTAVKLICRTCVGFCVCMQNDHWEKFLHAFAVLNSE